jgi:division protein CdvB (Snf7/Vps24/ESCRT-III family)
MNLKNTYTENMKVLLDEMNVSIQELETITKKRDSVTQSIFREELKKLREQLNIATEIFSEFKSAGEQSWEDLENEFEKVYEALKRSYHYFRTQI